MFTKKVFVCCPGNVITGGPELLHQFAGKLKDKGVDAVILYYPFDKKFQTPEPYQHYGVEVGHVEQVENLSVVVLPETATKLAPFFKKNCVAIWWLSVDNYYGCSPYSLGIKKLKHIASLLLHKKLTFSEMSKFIHFHQSEYARIVLEKKKLISIPMTDYIGTAHFVKSDRQALSSKKKLITYNPKKGFEVTQKLIKNFPGITFKPLQNMTPTEVNQVLNEAMIYIDFGNHPGKDRFPREAALANCCIITGRRGSAQNEIDLPIPAQFKIDENDKDFLKKFNDIAMKVFNDFESESKFFNPYRQKIMSEMQGFDNNVNDFINNYIKK